MIWWIIEFRVVVFPAPVTPAIRIKPDGIAHKLTRGLSDARRTGGLDYLRPDGKSQVTIEYDGSRPIRVDAVVRSTQHSPTVTHDTIRHDLTEQIIKATGSKSKLVYKPLPQDDPKQRKPDIAKAKKILKWEPQVKLAEGLTDTIAYFRTKV